MPDATPISIAQKCLRIQFDHLTNRSEPVSAGAFPTEAQKQKVAKPLFLRIKSQPTGSLKRIVHFELHRMHGLTEARHFGHFELNVSINHSITEDAALG